MYLLGTIFSCGLINIWCCREYMSQQDDVCVRGDEGTCQHVFLIVSGQQWSSVAQRKKIFQAVVQWFWAFYRLC